MGKGDDHRWDARKYLLAGLEVDTGFGREEMRIYRCDFGKGFQVEDGETIAWTMSIGTDGIPRMVEEPHKVIEMAQAPDGTWHAKDQGDHPHDQQDHPHSGGGYRLPGPGSAVSGSTGPGPGHEADR